MSEIAQTPQPPYYAVIFTSLRTQGDQGYGETADKMMAMVSRMKGFLGAESARDAQGLGITVSYWDSLESIEAWKHHAAHMAAKQAGKEKWYASYHIRISKVESANYFEV